MVRIQLSSNFQVVELTGDSIIDIIKSEDLDGAIRLVNDLGQKVNASTQQSPQKLKKISQSEPMATDGQIRFLIGMGYDEEVARSMTKKEAWKALQEFKAD